MGYTNSMSESDKKMITELVIRFAASAGMIIAGIAALCNHGKAIEAVSGLLGVFALIAGIVLLTTRFFFGKADGGGRVSVSGIIWLVIAFLLFNTSLLSDLGSAVIIICGAAAICMAIRFFVLAMSLRRQDEPYMSKAVPSALLCIIGIILIVNSQAIFEGMIVIGIGAYFIINGMTMLYEWVGRLRYFRNFRGVEK